MGLGLGRGGLEKGGGGRGNRLSMIFYHKRTILSPHLFIANVCAQ